MTDPADDNPTAPAPPHAVPPRPTYGPPVYGPPAYGPPAYVPPARAQPTGQPPYSPRPPYPGGAVPPWAPPYTQPGARAAQPFTTGAPSRPSSVLGVIALVAGVLAAVVAPVVASVASWQIGRGVGSEQAFTSPTPEFDPSIFTGVRDWVLMGEVAFWLGTLFGIWALAQGIVAIAKNRGRGPGITAVVLAVLGPIVFGIGVTIFLSAGIASGAGL